MVLADGGSVLVARSWSPLLISDLLFLFRILCLLSNIWKQNEAKTHERKQNQCVLKNYKGRKVWEICRRKKITYHCTCINKITTVNAAVNYFHCIFIQAVTTILVWNHVLHFFFKVFIEWYVPCAKYFIFIIS